MPTHVFFWPIVALVLVHIWFADAAFRELDQLRGPHPVRTGGLFGDSPAVSALLRDTSLPAVGDPPSFVRKLKVARVLGRATPFVIVFMFVLFAVFGEA